MGMFDNLTGLAGNLDLAELAAKVGLSEAQVQQALAALGQAQAQPGDTAENTANASGLPLEKVQELLAQISGGDLIGKLGQATSGLGGMFKG